MPASLNLSVVLPAYNEEENIERAVARALEVLPGIVGTLEVIVVDDGSHDSTAAATRMLVNRGDPCVRLVSHTRNLGYGAALRTGFAHARGELVFYTDADNQFDVAELAYFMPMMVDHDMVVGFRVYRYDTVVRSMLSWLYNRLVRILFRVRVRDVDCSFKLMRREVLDKVTIDASDFFVDTELVAKARKWNFRIGEKGVRHYPRLAGETTVHPGDIPRTLRTVVRMWQRIYLPSRRQLDELEERREALREAAVESPPGERPVPG